MRIIDGDALKELMDSHVTSMSVCISMDEHNGMQFMKEQCIEDVQNAPTIPAIPVEWLQNEADRQKDMGEWADADVIYWLIQTWQKEQEAR